MNFTKLVFYVFLCLVLGACASHKTSQNQTLNSKNQNILQDKNYKIINALHEDDDGVSYFRDIPDIHINFKGDKFYGFSGCNRFLGKFSKTNNMLGIDKESIASTKMLCLEARANEFEDFFLNHFHGRFEIFKESDEYITLVKEQLGTIIILELKLEQD